MKSIKSPILYVEQINKTAKKVHRNVYTTGIYYTNVYTILSSVYCIYEF